MATFRLDALRLRAQQESDMVNSGFVETTEWASFLNASYQELYGLLVGAFEDYFVAPAYTFVTDGINKDFALPSDLFKLRGVDLQVSGSTFWVTLQPFVFSERNRMGLVNSPIPSAGQTVQLWYVPVLTPLVNDSDVTVQLLNGQEEYIVIDAAMKALAKEESDVSVLMARKQAFIDRVNAEAANRDAGSPAHITDFYAARSPAMHYHLTGNNIRLIGGSRPPLPYGDVAGDWGW